MFPLPVEGLSGRRILFIGVSSAEPRVAYVVAGLAEWTGAELRVAYAAHTPSAVPEGSPTAWRGFDPAMLPGVLIPAAWERVRPLTHDIVACVIAWVARPLESALALTDPFFGLAANGLTGQIVLMQGDPSLLHWSTEDDDRDPAT